MSNDTRHYQLLSALIDYPEEGFENTVNEIQLYLDGLKPELGGLLEDFSTFASAAPLEEVRQLHTRTFDVQAITTLDLGYLLFGDDYKRAQLLVNLSREHASVGNPCGSELADHLPNVLRLISRMEHGDVKDGLIRCLVYPGIKKMIGEFDSGNREKKNELYRKHHKTVLDFSADYGILYQKPLQVLLGLIEEDFGIGQVVPEQKNDFLGTLSTEMEIEG